MSQEVFLRGLFSSIMSLFFAWIVFSRYDSDVGSEHADTSRQKYLPYISGGLLPIYLGLMAIMETVYYGITEAAHFTLSMCFGIFLHISIYYVALILVLPFFRKHISARACAMLWLLPNYLYFINHGFMELPKPWIVIPAPGNVAWTLFFLWLTGFLIVFIWKMVEHLIFRHRILADATLVTDPEIVSVWEKTLEDARIYKPRFKLVTSPHVKTPLSIGLFQRSIRIVLPTQDYSKDELELILRHEIIHISREDFWSKYFLTFCTAMCWFNPLMWMAMKKSAEDMELSCDETVLLEADEETRKKYALLLLDTASDERGFTTCLSASAKSMRYRLKNIAAPAKRHSGAITVGLTFFILCMTSGYVSLAYGGKSGGEIIYDSGDYSEYSIENITMLDDDYNTNYKITDEEAFHKYLSGLTLFEFTGNYSFSGSSETFTYLFNTPEGMLGVSLYDNAIKLTPLYEGHDTVCYYITEGVDWNYLHTIIVENPSI